jgi:hypothetical protein
VVSVLFDSSCDSELVKNLVGRIGEEIRPIYVSNRFLPKGTTPRLEKRCS